MHTPTTTTLLLTFGFFLFLVANLLLGLYKGRNVKTMKDYALANRAMGTRTLMITIIATTIGTTYVTSVLIAGQEKGIIGLKFTNIKGTQDTISSIGEFFKAVQNKVAKGNLHHLSIVNHDRLPGIPLSILQCNIIFFSPPIINRVLAARNRPQVRQAFVFMVVENISKAHIDFSTSNKATTSWISFPAAEISGR